MEFELEPRVKPLPYKVKASSRESPSQKAAHVLDTELRTHWSTGTNTKEWILLELDEPCLLSHIRVHNKSVLEWEITAGLRFKPETFVKVRPRCEAPRRDMMYPVNYTACRFVRISCLRGNPIAIFFIQLIGVTIVGLEPEFQPVVNYLLPHIVSHKQDDHDMHLQLLQDITSRLLTFLPYLESDLISLSEAADFNIRFFAMLVGPFYPILRIVNDRSSYISSDSDVLKNKLTLTLTVSSNFEMQPRRSRSPSPFSQPASSSIAFRPDTVFMLLRKAYKESHLGTVCRTASRALQKLTEPTASVEGLTSTGDAYNDDGAKIEVPCHFDLNDYSSLFGEEFKINDNGWDVSHAGLLDIASVEEAILHVLYASASQPILCCKLADNNAEFWSLLPLIQALLPAIRPSVGSPSDQVDDTLTHWRQPLVQHALSQIAAMSSSSSSVSHSLLRASAGYLSSYLPSQAKAACMLIDLCFGPLAPWTPLVISKIDLAMELLEDLLGTIQSGHQSISRARAALKYIILALSGHMDGLLAKYKECKHKVLFLVEMLEPFLDPAITAMKTTIAFGDVPTRFMEKQEKTCEIALNIIHTAVRRADVLPSLESEWIKGTVAPSVLLSILGPHMPLPHEIDLCKYTVPKIAEKDLTPADSGSSDQHRGYSSKSSTPDETDGKYDFEAMSKLEGYEDANLLFAPSEVKNMILINYGFSDGVSPDKNSSESNCTKANEKHHTENFLVELTGNSLNFNTASSFDFYNFQANYLHLLNLDDCERRAGEFQCLAFDLHSQHDITPEGHDAAIDALLLASECYVNPFFMITFGSSPQLINKLNSFESKIHQKDDIVKLAKHFDKNINNVDSVSHLETKRDKIVLEILLQAADWEREHQKITSQQYIFETENYGHGLEISPLDMQSADAVTLVRQNQALLCQFLTQRLLKEQGNLHEILLQGLLFYLETATELFCPPENVIDIILNYAEHVNKTLTSFYRQVKDNNGKVDTQKLHSTRRCWLLLHNLVIASSGSDSESNCRDMVNGFQYGSLIPFSSWVQKISKFSVSPCPLARFVGWMAVSHFAKKYLKEHQCFALDQSYFTSLLSIFLDELSLVDSIANEKVEVPKLEVSGVTQNDKVFECLDRSSAQDSCNVIYPDLHMFLPDLKIQFRTFGEIILEAIALQLKSIPSFAISDALCWFSELCLSPFLETKRCQGYVGRSTHKLSGNAGRNAQAITLYLIEAIIKEHLEVMVPEMPRIAQILVSLCKASYSDVNFLDSVLHLLKPFISYALAKVCDGEGLFISGTSCYDYEVLCFGELFDNVRCEKRCNADLDVGALKRQLVIFMLGSLFPDLSLQRKKEILQYLSIWADFTSFAPTSLYFDYLQAFQRVMDSCIKFLFQSLVSLGIEIPGEQPHYEVNAESTPDDKQKSPSDLVSITCISTVRAIHLSQKDLKDIAKSLGQLLSRLHPAIDLCWKLHFQLAHKLTVISARCHMMVKCLNSISEIDHNLETHDGTNINQTHLSASEHWRSSLEGLIFTILALQDNHCWQVASAMLDYLLNLPEVFPLKYVYSSVCLAIKRFSCHAPRISWRLQADKWMSLLFARKVDLPHEEETALVDLFCNMLGHSEPEQRSTALKHLGCIVGMDINDSFGRLYSVIHQDSVSISPIFSVPETTISNLVSSAWDKVAALASSDPLLLLRARAMALLSGFIPFAGESQLQSFFISAEGILPGIAGNTSIVAEPLMRHSLSLLAHACVYSSTEDIALIPDGVWRNLESMKTSQSGLGVVEKKLCQALCELRSEAVDAKEVLNKTLSSTSAATQNDSNFKHTRESILQVLSSLTSVQSYFDFFSKKMDQEAQELEEAEIEMDLLKEKALNETSERSEKDRASHTTFPDSTKDNDRLNVLKNEIRDLERSKLREEIAARRQQQLLARHNRQKYLEAAALREMELQQDLDRERMNEVAKEFERQRLLELERAKTKELRYILDMERERQAQRELQRELEQAESGVQTSRREFSSNASSRTRERYRDRENGRPGHEGSVRPSSRGRESGVQTVPTLLQAGSRSFSNQPPTILQSRDRSDEHGTGYEDSFEGSRDSGDAGSIGDPDSGSVFDGLPGVFGSGTRPSRGSKSRQIVERREREGRREGKWERKHS